MQKDIALSSIVIGEDNLRTVRETDAEFVELRDSIEAKGVLLPIVVSEKVDVDGNPYFLLVDGAHRFTAAQHLSLETIPANVVETKDGDEGKLEVLEMQIAANAQRAETRPAEYASALKSLMMADLLMSKSDLAAKVNKSVQWIDKMLSLNKVKNEVIREKIDNGDIPVTNAYALAKLSDEDQVKFVDSAMTMAGNDFANEINEFIKNQKEAARQGRGKVERTFPAKPSRRKDSEIIGLIEDEALLSSIVSDSGASTVADAFKIGLQYSLSLDPETLSARKQEWEEGERMRKEKSEKQKAIRAAARAEEKKIEREEAANAAAEAAAQLSDDELAEAKKLAAENRAKKAAKKAEAEEAKASEEESAE